MSLTAGSILVVDRVDPESAGVWCQNGHTSTAEWLLQQSFQSR